MRNGGAIRRRARIRRRWPVVAALCLLSLVPDAIALAEGEAKRVELSGHVRLRAETDDKTDYSSRRSFSLLRVRPAVTIRPDSDVSVLVEPQFARTMGESGLSGNTTDPAFGVHQAYVDYHPWDWSGFLLGRQVLAYGDELVVGALDWNNTGRSFDAFRARVKHGEGTGWSDLFTAKLVNGNISGGGDKDFHGVYITRDLGSAFKAVDVYAFYLKDETGIPATRPTDLWTAGTRLKSPIEDFDYRAEATGQWGTSASGSQKGHQADLEAGYTFSKENGMRMALEGFTSSADYNQLFPTSHKWLGYADVLGRRNVSGGAARGSMKLTDNLSANADYHRFYRTNRGSPAFKINGTTTLGSTSRSDSTDVGTELDLTLKYKASEPVLFIGGASVFSPGTYLRDQFGAKRPLFYYVQMEVKF